MSQSQPSPETFIVECNRKLASEEYPEMNSKNNEWMNLINPPFQIRQGDEIKVSNTFINEIGASSDILIFNNSDAPDNKTRMVYSFYAMDDNINQKRNAINIVGRSADAQNHEYCTLNPIELMRYQPFSYWVQPSDRTVQPYPLFFPNEISQLIKGTNNNDLDERVWFPCEDRYLPSRFFSYLEIGQTAVTNASTSPYKIQLDPATNIITISNNTGDDMKNKLKNFIQKGMIVELETDRTQLQIANDAHLYLDGYYSVCDTRNWTSATPDWIKLFPQDDTYGGLHQAYNIDTYSSGSVPIGGTVLIFRPNALFDGLISVGLWISTGVGNTIFQSATKVVSIANGTVIDQNVEVINGYNTLGQAGIRINDVTLVENYETISAPANTYIPNTSHILTIIPDTSIDRKGIARGSSLVGSNIINLYTNDANNTPSLETTMFYNITDDNDIVYNIQTWSGTGIGSHGIQIDDYKRTQNPSMFFKTILAPTDVLRVDNIAGINMSNMFLFGSAGQYIDYSSYLTFTAKISDTFISTTKINFNQLNGQIYPIGYSGQIGLANNMAYSLFTHSAKYMIATVGIAGVNQYDVQISDNGVDMFGNPLIYLNHPLTIPIGSATDAGYSTIQHGYTINGTYYAGQLSPTEYNIIVNDLSNMSGLIEGAFFDTGLGYLRFPKNTRIISFYHPAGYPADLWRIVLDTATTTGTQLGGIYNCETSFTNIISIHNPDGNTAGTITHTGSISTIDPYIGVDQIISQAPLTFAQLALANIAYNNDNIYIGAVCSNVVTGMPLDNRVNDISDVNITIGGVTASFETGIQSIYFQNAMTSVVPQGVLLQIGQRCIPTNCWITNIEDNGYMTMTLSANLLEDFKNGRNKVKISRPFANSGTVFMEDNLTANIPLSTILTFSTTHTEVTIDKGLASVCPPDTTIYFSAISVDEPNPLPFNLQIKPKGYSYELQNQGDIEEGRDYGIKWSDGGSIGDEMYQYKLTTRTNAGVEPNSNDNVSNINDVVALRIDGFKPRMAINNYNNNSLIRGQLDNSIDFETGNMVISFPTMSTTDFTALFSDTSTIFNLRRSLAFYLWNPEESFTDEYCRIPNGANDQHISPYVSIVKDIANKKLTIQGVRRGVMNTPKFNWGVGTTVWLYDENLFNEDFITTINSECHEFSDDGNAGIFDWDEAEGQTYFYTTDVPDDVILQCEGILPNGFTGRTTLGNLPNNYIYACQNYSTKSEWVKHYEYHDLDLGDAIHLSPSDVGSIITDSFHKPANAKASMDGITNLNITLTDSVNRIGGLDIPESMGYIPHNRLYIPIWSTPCVEACNHISGVGFASWYSENQPVRSEPYDYSFKFSCRFTNYPLRIAQQISYLDNNGVSHQPLPAGSLIDTDFDVWCRGGQLSVPNQLQAGVKSDSYPINIFSGGNVFHIGTLSDTTLIQVLMSQMCGSNNLTMNYNAGKNRTELMFAHNPYTTPVSMANNVVEGGDIATFVPTPAINGYDNLRPFHSPYLSKTGGINIENYSSEVCVTGQYTPLTAFNNYNGTQTTKEYDMLNPFYDTTKTNTTNMEDIGIKFWTKLGWTTNQLVKERGSEYNSVTGILNLKGTTQGQVDSADNQFFKEVPATDQGDSVNQQNLNINGQNVFAYGSVGGYKFGKAGSAPASGSNPAKGTEYLRALNNSRTGYNLPSTSGTPLFYYDPIANSDPNGVIITNPDYWLYTGYSVLSDGSSTLQAKFLPEKTDVPYFLMFCPELSSNNNFYTTKNKGSIDPEAISVISKLNVSQDYYFAYQSPITFYAKSDFILSTITTKILTPQKTVPKNLGDASSVIYSITRYNPLPLTIQPTLTQVQDTYVNNMIQMEKMKDQMTNQQEHQSELQKINSLIESISESVLTPDDNQASIITGVLQQAQNIGLFGMDRTQMRDFVVNHPMAVGMMNALTHIQNMGFNARQPVANPEIQNVGRNVDEIITGVPVPNQNVQAMGKVLDMPFEPNISQPNTPVVAGGLPNPQEISDAINRSVYQESLLRGEAQSFKDKLGQGQPKEIGFLSNPNINQLTPTAELGNRIRAGIPVLNQESPTTTGSLTRSGEGRRQFNEARLALANQIAQKHSILTENIATRQYLPTGQKSALTRQDRPRNLTEAEAHELGTLRHHRQHQAMRSAPPTYKTTGSDAPTYNSATSGNPIFKDPIDYEESSVPPSYHADIPEE